MSSKNNFTQVPNLSDLEKLTIDAQNSIIKQIFQDKLQIQVHDISRDKDGHIYVLLLKNSDIEAYTLAYNTDENIITAYRVGDIGYTIRGNIGVVDLLCIHRAFFNKGIGTILLQAFENYAYGLDVKTIRLNSVKTFMDTSSKHIDINDISDEMNPQEYRNYILKNFHDVNFYFYSTFGFVKVKETLRCTKMEKKNLKNISLRYGLDKKTILFKRKYLPDITKSLGKDSFIETAISTQKKDYFYYDKHQCASERIYPLKIKPTFNDFKILYEILLKSNIRRNPTYSSMRSNQTYCNNYYYDKYDNLEEFYRRINSTNEEKKVKNTLSSETNSQLQIILQKYIEAYTSMTKKIPENLNFDLDIEPNL